jgi:hypothetical protein
LSIVDHYRVCVRLYPVDVWIREIDYALRQSMPVPTTEYRERPEATKKVLFSTPRITPMKEREYTEGPENT